MTSIQLLTRNYLKMKKVISIFTVFLSLGVYCTAQDTVRYMDPYYFFEEMYLYQDSNTVAFPMSNLFLRGDYVVNTNYYNSGVYDFAMRYIDTKEAVLVYGVAFTPFLHNLTIDKYDFELFLAQIRNDSIFFVDSTQWKPTDHQAWFEYSIPFGGLIYDSVVPVYELYFDTPRLIRDTFCVGYRGEFMSLYHTIDSATTYFIADPHENTTNCSAHLDSMTFHTFAGDQDDWWGGIFPIIEYRHPCETPSGPRPIVYAATNPNLVQFQLPYSAGDSMWLSIAEYGQPADSGIIYNVTDSVMDIVVPDSGYYTARLCSFCTKYWDVPMQSAWSAPANFMITSNLGIVRPDLQQPGSIVVTPNPTHGTVRIVAEGVRAVWLVAADGRRTQLPCKDGTVSLKAFAPGLYVLEVQTADGLYKAKVVKE